MPLIMSASKEGMSAKNADISEMNGRVTATGVNRAAHQYRRSRILLPSLQSLETLR